MDDSRNSESDNDHPSCCVCYNECSDQLPCGHVVCFDCYMRLHESCTPQLIKCPMCRNVGINKIFEKHFFNKKMDESFERFKFVFNQLILNDENHKFKIDFSVNTSDSNLVVYLAAYPDTPLQTIEMALESQVL